MYELACELESKSGGYLPLDVSNPPLPYLGSLNLPVHMCHLELATKSENFPTYSHVPTDFLGENPRSVFGVC